VSTVVWTHFYNLRRAESLIRQNTELAKDMRTKLGELTGHGFVKRPISCTCGYHAPGYPSDQQRLVGNHILTEWEKAALRENPGAVTDKRGRPL